MKTVDAIIEILRREGVEFLSCFPTTSVIDAAASAGMRPVICRQERVGVGIADGFARVTNGRRPAVFAMQYGPGAENAFAGVATAYSDSTPMLLIPLGQASAIAGVPPIFSSEISYGAVTKWVERLDHPHRLSEVMRRAFSRVRHGKPGPVMVEFAADIMETDIGDAYDDYAPVVAARAAADPRDVLAAARALVEAERPVILAGQGVMYAEASDELVALAELLQIPVVTTMLGKSAFPEDHPLSAGTAATVMSPLGYRAMADADVVLAVGASLTRHPMSITVPPGKTVIHAVNDEADLNKSYTAAHPLLGDAKLTLAQLSEAAAEVRGTSAARDNGVAAELAAQRDAWLGEWSPALTSGETPINPYRVIHEMQRAIPPSEAIVTHDSGSPRDQMLPFYVAPTPRSYLGWGKSHGLGTGLGLTIGAKLAAPDKVCINVMGDAAFGMTGLDVETAVRAEVPIITVVFNNGTMAIENRNMIASHERYKARDLGGAYADIGRALGAHAERVADPEDVGAAFRRARRVTEERGQAVVLEFMTSAETRFSHRRAL